MSSLDKLHFSNTFATLPEIFFSPHQPLALSEDFLIHCNPLVAELPASISDFEHYAGHPPEWAQRIEVSCSS